MAMAAEQVEEYVTSDIALIAWLRYAGLEPIGTEWRAGREDPVCYWRFLSGTRLAVYVDIYMSTNATVEPREFTRLYGVTKKEMFGSRPAQTA